MGDQPKLVTRGMNESIPPGAVYCTVNGAQVIYYVQEENVYNANEVDVQLARELAENQRQKELEHKRKLAAEYGEDVWQTGTALRFHKQFDQNGGRVYRYGAFKATEKWYITGGKASPQGLSWRLSWEELVLFLVGGPVPTEAYMVDIATNWQSFAAKRDRALRRSGGPAAAEANQAAPMDDDAVDDILLA